MTVCRNGAGDGSVVHACDRIAASLGSLSAIALTEGRFAAPAAWLALVGSGNSNRPTDPSRPPLSSQHFRA